MVLLKLMEAFKLLRPLQSVDVEKYLVPAMLVTDKLPREYVEPKWWCPSFASDFAEMSVDDTSKRAEMRIIYQVLCGRLPFGCMSELQVSLAQQVQSVQEGRHYAPETAVVDRRCGSVLSAAYKCGGGRVREWVIVSRDQMVQEQANPEAAVHASDCIRVMAWGSLGSDKGAIVSEKNGVLCGCRRQAVKILARRRSSLELLSLEFDGGVKQDNDRDLVLPGGSAINLMKGKQHRLQEYTIFYIINRVYSCSLCCFPNRVYSCSMCCFPFISLISEPLINRVEAFFAKQTDDREIDVQREAQLMMRCLKNPDCGWECSVHPQPTIQDLISSIEFAKQRNIRVLHLAGHCAKKLGFEWNAHEEATEIKTSDDVVDSALIGTQAGQRGPIECVVLNACCTEDMGRMLRERGVPNVVCWKTPVHDETAREMCGHFFTALGTDKERKRDYKRAFAAAMHAMRPLSHTHGAKDLSDTVAASASVAAPAWVKTWR